MADIRVGLGFDVHPPDPGRPLMLGGVPFEGEPGLAGYSNADVVCHALGDALLGAVALGDLGEHFPEDDPSFEGMEGRELLARVVALVAQAGWVPDSCDLVVVAERPRLRERRGPIRSTLAGILGIEEDRVSVKASRPEGLGLTGQGIGCLAVAVLRSA